MRVRSSDIDGIKTMRGDVRSCSWKQAGTGGVRHYFVNLAGEVTVTEQGGDGQMVISQSANDMTMHGVLVPNPKQDQDRYVPDVPKDQAASTGDRHYVHLHMSLPLSFHTDDVLKVRLSSYI